MMTFRMKLVKLCLVFGLLLSLTSFALVGVVSSSATTGNSIRIWSQVDNTNLLQVVSGGCQLDGSCSGGFIITG